MARRLRLTKRASGRLSEILIHLEDNFGTLVAKRFLKRTYSFFDILTEFPQIGTLEDAEKGIYGFVIEKPITLFYRYNEREIVVLNLFDNRMNPQKRP
jgi:plasmid stabilization system protein ParE